METQPPLIVQALDKVDQVVARLQELQSTIAFTRFHVVSRASPKTRTMLTFNKSDDGRLNGPPEDAPSLGEWRHWSTPAGIVHQAISDILVAAKFTKAMANGVAHTLEERNKEFAERCCAPTEASALHELPNGESRRPYECTTLPAEGEDRMAVPKFNGESRCPSLLRTSEDERTTLPAEREDRMAVPKFKVLVPPEGSALNAVTSVHDEVSTAETHKMKIVGLNRRSQQELSRKTGHWKSPSKVRPSEHSMVASKIKQSQKSWKQIKSTKSKDAVMFPNLAYSPSSPPPNSKNFRILTPFKTRNAVSSPKRKVGMNLAAASDAHRVPLLGKKRQVSPVKSLPALIDRLPSKRKPGTAPAATSVVCRAEELPYPPSHFLREDKSAENVARCDSRRTAGSKVRSRSSSAPRQFKVLESNALTGNSDDAVLQTQAKRNVEQAKSTGGKSGPYLKLNDEKSGRARSISPWGKHSEKENLLTTGNGSSLRRSWSAGSGLIAPKNLGHSMLQRAKGWMLGMHTKQQIRR